MKTIKITSYILIICLLTYVVLSQQWYMPDSNMISDQQFNVKVLNDPSTFKFVKYFTPHCAYCRYLKNVIDPLKHQKEWCFKIYDLNCQWYHPHCANHVRTGMYPYTAIHNGQGTVIDQIPGFYPQPVIRNYFDRIQAQCLQYKRSRQPQSVQKQTKSSLSTQETIEQQPIKSIQQPKKMQQNTQIKQTTEINQQIVPQQKQQKVDQTHDPSQKQSILKQLKQLIKSQIKQQTKNEIRQQIKRQMQQQQKIIKSQVIIDHHKNIQKAQNQYIKYIIYGIFTLIAIYYFNNFNKNEVKTQLQNPQTIQKKSQTRINQDTFNNKGINKHGQHTKGTTQIEQSQLLSKIPDQQL